MKHSCNAFRLGLAAGLLLTAVIGGQAQAQVSMTDPDSPVACQAFERWGGGSWTATASTRLNYDNGMALNIAPGETFSPNQTVAGIEVTSTLDRHCGNM